MECGCAKPGAEDGPQISSVHSKAEFEGPPRSSRAASLDCTLGDEQLTDRGARWSQLFRRSAVGHTRTPRTLRVRFKGSKPTRTELEELAGLERECCSHLRWSVSVDGSDLMLTIRGATSELDRLRPLVSARSRDSPPRRVLSRPRSTR